MSSFQIGHCASLSIAALWDAVCIISVAAQHSVEHVVYGAWENARQDAPK